MERDRAVLIEPTGEVWVCEFAATRMLVPEWLVRDSRWPNLWRFLCVTSLVRYRRVA
jgi:hypothetical protein